LTYRVGEFTEGQDEGLDLEKNPFEDEEDEKKHDEPLEWFTDKFDGKVESRESHNH
jgi:hypothetical protein